MKKLIAAGVLMAGMMMSAQASAAVWMFSFTGTISDQYAVDRNFTSIATPVNPVKIGDAVSGTVTFDTSNQTFKSSEGAFNFYYPAGSDFALNIGSGMSFASVPGETIYTSVSLSNENTSAGPAYDMIGVTPLIYSKTPIAGFSDKVAVNFQYRNYDAFVKPLQGQTIDDIRPLSEFCGFCGSLFVGFVDDSVNGTGTIFNMSVTNLNASLVRVDAVPEPATWMLMLTGMMMTGYALRRRAVVAKLA